MPGKLTIATIFLLAVPVTGWGQEAPIVRMAERLVQPVVHIADEPPELLPSPSPQLERHSALSLADLEQIALANNPALATAAARIEAAQGRWVQAGLYPNPIVGYHATEIGTMDSSGAQGTFVSQRIITGGKRKLDRAVAGAEIREAEFGLSTTELRVLSDVRVRYYNALVAQRRTELTRELARIGDDLTNTSQRLLKARQISENDVLQAEIEAEQVHILHDNAGHQYHEQWRRLAAVLGVPGMQCTVLAGRLDESSPRLDWDATLAGVFTQSPELAAAYARVERARLATARANREWVPNIDTFVSVRHQDATGDDIVNIQVGLPIPVFDANQGNVARANADWAAAQHDVRRIELDLQDRLAVAYRRYANARQQAARYRDNILPRAQRSLDLVKDAYGKGQIDYLTLLISQRTFYQVNLAYLDSLQELWEAVTVIESQLLGGSLAGPR